MPVAISSRHQRCAPVTPRAATHPLTTAVRPVASCSASSTHSASRSPQNSNPFTTTTAANATLDYVLDHDLQANAARLGQIIIPGLREAAAASAAGGSVRGRGLMFALDMIDPRTGQASAPLAARMLEETRERGLLIGKGGLAGNTLRMAPPLTLSEAEAKEGLQLLCDALTAVNEEATAK